MSYYQTPEIEVIPVSSRDVACDGGGGATGHPIEYLHINHHSKDVVCPYCSRRYVLEG